VGLITIIRIEKRYRWNVSYAATLSKALVMTLNIAAPPAKDIKKLRRAKSINKIQRITFTIFRVKLEKNMDAFHAWSRTVIVIGTLLFSRLMK
jgi:hypothetical protein